MHAIPPSTNTYQYNCRRETTSAKRQLPSHLLSVKAGPLFHSGTMAAPRSLSRVLLLACFSLVTLRSTSKAEGDVELPFEACAEFAGRGTQLSWTLDECMQVWAAWAETVPEWLHLGYPDRRLMKDVSMAMRERGQPCVVQERVRADGVGSEVTRHLAAWLYAEELGCDWVTPNFGYEAEADTGPEGGTLYCHPSAALEEFEGASSAEQNLESCELVDWLEYFNLDETSVPEPDALFHNVTGDPQDTEDLTAVLGEIEENGLDSFPEDFRLRFTFHPSIGSRYTLALGSWDQYKRDITRGVLSRMRANFHKFPRPWYDEVPDCGYKPTQMNFAMHVRMGDRRAIQGGLDDDYFTYLHGFMDDVTHAVVSKGLEPPMFHVYTQTLLPCPSRDAGLFVEFPLWPVEMDQVAPCFSAPRPSDCAEKRAGAANCNAERTGIFKVQNMPLMLHVGDNVHECLTCMIQADGVLMGCSTFGQIVGLLTKGIRFFSVGCVGHVTPVQYRMIPPLAVAEYGHMYVPISGSWRNPAIMFPSVFDTILQERLMTKGWKSSGGSGGDYDQIAMMAHKPT